MFLDEIINHKRQELEARKVRIPLNLIKPALWKLSTPLEFRKALLPPADGRIRVIAEVKRASPSKGLIRNDFNHLDIARGYQKNGASAISVLTDTQFFQGSIDYLSEIRPHVTIPLLRKDFIIDEYQIFEARAYGADAVLLIASVLRDKELSGFTDLSLGLGMMPLIEVHNEEELEKTLKTKADVIGINNRDLKSFTTNIEITERIIKSIPEDIIVISESGINTVDDITRLKEAGVDAFLIGEALMREQDYGKKLREFVFGVQE